MPLLQEERQQLEAAAREAFEACDTFVGIFLRAREAREAGSRSALGIARNWKSPGAARSSGADEARSSWQQLGATRAMPIRARLPRKRGKQRALGKQTRKE